MSEANQLLRGPLKLPTGYSIAWSGQYETMRAGEGTAEAGSADHAPSGLPPPVYQHRLIAQNTYRLAGSTFFGRGCHLVSICAGYNMSVAVWVGLIALLGIDAETGVFMLLYLDLSYEEARREGRLKLSGELRRSNCSRRCKTCAAEVHDFRNDLPRACFPSCGPRAPVPM